MAYTLDIAISVNSIHTTHVVFDYTATRHMSSWAGSPIKYVTPDTGGIGFSRGGYPIYTFVISGLQPNTAYSIYIEGRYDYDSEWEASNTVEVTTLSLLPGEPINPTPIDLAEEVDFSSLTLSWDSGGATTSYNVFFGPDGDLKDLGNIEGTSIIVPYTTEIDGDGITHAYINEVEINWNVPLYWRVDAINIHGTTTSDVWHFDARPAKVANPVPDDEEKGIDLATESLSWSESLIATEYAFYFREKGDDWKYINSYITPTASIPITFPYDTRYHTYEWRTDATNTFGVTIGDTWSFIIIVTPYIPIAPRWPDYDPDKVWDEDTETWVSPDTVDISGGGKHQNQLVVVGMNSVGQGKIYIGGI